MIAHIQIEEMEIRQMKMQGTDSREVELRMLKLKEMRIEMEKTLAKTYG